MDPGVTAWFPGEIRFDRDTQERRVTPIELLWANLGDWSTRYAVALIASDGGSAWLSIPLLALLRAQAQVRLPLLARFLILGDRGGGLVGVGLQVGCRGGIFRAAAAEDISSGQDGVALSADS